MTHFVAFTYGKYQGARIAFHSIPKYGDGEYVQPLDSVGTQELFGDSSGCIRVLPDDAELFWSWLDIGDTVTWSPDRRTPAAESVRRRPAPPRQRRVRVTGCRR